MTADLVIVLAILGGAVALFLLGRPRADAVALLVLLLLPLTGQVSLREALEGFSNPNVILIACLFVIGEGLARAGLAQKVGDWLMRHSGTSESRLMIMLMVVVGLMGSIMSSAAVVAIFIPIVLRISRQSTIASRKVLLPMGTAAAVSGMLTLVATTPNLIINSALTYDGYQGFDFFDFTPIGLAVMAAAVVYMLAARHLLHERKDAAPGRSGSSIGNWTARYGLHRDVDTAEVIVPPESSQAPVPEKAPHALFALGVLILLLLTDWVPNVMAGLIACLLMGLFGCVTLDVAYRSINWRALILIVGMLPFAVALEHSGGVDLAAETLIHLAGTKGIYVQLGLVFLATVILGIAISGTATAVLMGPIAIHMAEDLQASPHAFAMVVAIGASAAFMSPVSTPANALVSVAGGYKFSEYLKIGTPMMLMALLISVLLIPLLFP